MNTVLIVPLLGCVMLLASCDRVSALDSAAAPAESAELRPNYSLSCAILDDRPSQKVLCVRMNTKTGDSKLVELDSLPLAPPHADADTQDGHGYSVRCMSYHAEQHSFVCVRLDEGSGRVERLPVRQLPRLEQPPISPLKH